MQNIQKCQIIILTGYLGSGKTTFISYLLKTIKDIKVAVIQNEFADEMGIEAPLIKDIDGNIFDKFYELPNGCICCSAKGQLITAIDYFLKENSKIQYIIVESNGLADPSNLIKEMWVDDGLDMNVKLHSVISFLPLNRIDKLWNNDLFQRQIIYADLMVLNFQEKYSQEQTQIFENQIKELNPTTKILATNYSQIPLEEIFTLKHNQPDNLPNIHGDNHLKTNSTIFLQFQGEKTKNEWEQLFGYLLWESQKMILRIKGLLTIKNSQQFYSIQGVEEIFEIQETDLKVSQEANQNKILIIGQNLDKADLIKLFSANN